MKLWIHAAIETVLQVITVALFIIAVLIHFWTMVIAYGWSDSSFIVGLTFMFPIFSEIVWALILWMKSGTFFTPYAMVLVGFVVVVVIVLFVSNLLDRSKIDV